MSRPNTQYEYVTAFLEATEFSVRELNPDLTPSLLIDPSWSMPLKNGLKMAAGELQRCFADGRQLGGDCFLATALMSMGFMRAGIPHAITIGNVEWKSGELYVKATRESLMKDIELGFNPRLEDGKPVLDDTHAHAWITLPSGEVVDATIISARDRVVNYRGRGGSDLRLWIYRNQNKDVRIARHIPLLTGLNFHLQVVTGIRPDLGIRDKFLSTYLRWAKEYLTFVQQM